MSNNQLGNWLKAHLLALLLLAGGIAFVYVALKLDTEYVRAPATRLLSYVGFLLISLAVILFCVKHKWVVVVNVVIMFLLVVVIEVVCFFTLGMPGSNNKKFAIPLLPAEHIAMNVGIVPYADSIYHSVLVKNEDTVYDVRISIDAENLRITPDHDSTKNKFALFFGCSIAFGLGLEDDETLPYFFQDAGKYNAYNYAYNGYGTNHMLSRLEYKDLSERVVEKDGVAVYVFFWDHIYRAIGSMNRYSDWLSNAPYYTFEDDQLTRKKMFKDGRYYVSKIYEYAYQTNIVKQFKIDFPFTLTDRHFDLITEMILKSKEVYSKQFGNDNFYVALYPSYVEYSEDEMNQFKMYLKEKNINSIDLSDFIKYGAEYTLGGDPHPNASTNKMIADELWRRIN